MSHDKLPRDQIQRRPSQPQEANLVPSLLILRPVTYIRSIKLELVVKKFKIDVFDRVKSKVKL